MSVQIIEKSGKPEYAVIPYAEYQELLEMAQDARDTQDADAAKAELLAVSLVAKAVWRNPRLWNALTRTMPAHKSCWALCSVSWLARHVVDLRIEAPCLDSGSLPSVRKIQSPNSFQR